MFQLTEEEVDLMVSQNAIPSKQHLGGGNGLPSQSLRKTPSGLWKGWRGNKNNGELIIIKLGLRGS